MEDRMAVLKFDPERRRKKLNGGEKSDTFIARGPEKQGTAWEVVRAQMDILKGDGFDVSNKAEVLLKLIPVTTHLNSLEGFVSQQSILLRREGLRELSLSMLLQRLEDSGPSNWTMHPAYYRAIVIEISRKVTGDV
jgi:hypothetical protein